MAFDYDTDDGPDLETVRSVAAEMADAGKPTPPTRSEREMHQAWLAECRERDRQQRLESERRQAEAAELAEHEVVAAAAEARAKLQQETRERLDREARRRQRELDTADLRRRVKQQEIFQHNVEVAAQVSARKAVALRMGREKMDRAARIFAAIDSRLNPPPEPEV